MKKFFLIAILGIVSFTSFGQGTIDLTVRWSSSLNRYEVYARPTFTNASFTWGTSQVSVVVPASAPNVSLSITSANAGGWSTFNKIYAPSAASTLDFHSVISSGQPVALVTGQEVLLFSFTFPDGTCRDGVRLFVNASDPSSSGAGMQGGDFKNAIDNGLVADVYNVNYNNTGTTCSTCTIVAPELIK